MITWYQRNMSNIYINYFTQHAVDTIYTFNKNVYEMSQTLSKSLYKRSEEI